MDNNIKKHIDKLKKQSLKEALNAPISEIRHTEIKKQIDEDYEYCHWMKNTTSIHSSSYFPTSKKEFELFNLLSLEILYKQNFKQVCDSNHPVLIEQLLELGLTESEIEICIEKVKTFNGEKLDYFDLFEDEIFKKDNLLDEIIQKIDQLASDASQGTIVSHPAKMSHPDSRYPRIFVEGERVNDGFVKTGNVKVEFDMHINAAKLKIFKFLSLKFNGSPLLNYIKNNDKTVFKNLFGVMESKAEKWISSFSVCFEQHSRTGTNIRQVYFPVTNDYHLLSILRPSGLVFKLKEKIDYLNDRSPIAFLGKKLRKEGKFFDKEFNSLLDLTVTKHGGDHPKNISGLNNKHQVYYLLRSTPPTLEKKSIRFPKTNFFGESIRVYECREIFSALHKLLITDYNNHKIREGRDYRLKELLERIIAKMWMVRTISPEDQSIENSSIKEHQMIWLNNLLLEKRENEDQWLEKLIKEIARWIILSYEKVNGKNSLMFGKDLQQHIVRIVTDNKEALR